MYKNTKIKIFSSFEEENQAEYTRRSKMGFEERMQEFALLQERAWGPGWNEKPIVKKATFEKLDW